MFSSQTDFLLSFGWDDFFEEQIKFIESEDLFPGRVVGEEKNLYRVQVDQDLILLGSVPGRFMHQARSRADFPAVGDWVLCRPTGDVERVLIEHCLERRSVIQRKQVGSSLDMQIIASNIDWVFIATSINEDLNIKRLDRYLTLAWNSGASPVVLLTKSDLCEDVEIVVSDLEDRFPGVPIHAVSIQDPSTLASLGGYLSKGRTSVVVGSSGVGKSSLVNALLGHAALKTQEIREDDAKGRHTTTARYVLKTPSGGLIIDTPGMRELQMTDEDEGLNEHFEDIESLVLNCRFTDCRHETEPGCAIRKAIHEGELHEERWQSYLKLLSEIRFQQRKQSKALQSAEKERWKKIHREVKDRSKLRPRF